MKVIIGITGGIAAYKVPELVRLFRKAGHEVQCVATSHALEFVTPLTLETVSGNKLYSDLFAPANDHTTEHVSLKDWGDIMVVAPATANIIGKMASGIGDDALSTLLLAFSGKPLYVCPAMNTQMMENPAVIRNIETLKSWGIHIIDATEGELACGTTGKGRMEEPERIFEIVCVPAQGSVPGQGSSLTGKNVLITAGPTYERIDAVRFIGNFSSGKMGFALAEEFSNRGAKVTLVTGPTAQTVHNKNIERIDVESAQQMYDACVSHFDSTDIAVLSAAVADYRPESTYDGKMKKQGDEGMVIRLVQNPDILATLGKRKRDGQMLVGFALESSNEMEYAQSKLQRKGLDMIVMNSLRDKGACFGTDTNKITIINRKGDVKQGTMKSKADVAKDIVESVADFLNDD
ncbi:MAG: bifunctional phosphopantothenoylcysteine decarboxylase/phosphopantothenate--cysteine ligase CoaBC [Bacteroidales bacterium]|nr:bifunctional phosphopantothenoylcysteine decarboxylase/phosphopantothenate--cysteine ligase CoaBC [Bacteroidales bacterium]